MFDQELSQHLPAALLRAITHAEARLASPPPALPPALAIAFSREAGSGGAQVARLVGARLGWAVYDHELLERMAGDMQVRVSLLESVDERRTHWLEERVEAFAAVPHVNSNSYVRHLVQTILSLGELGKCIIVGRGAPILLPARTTLRVRLVAAWDDRVKAVGQEWGLSPQEAAHKVKALDRERWAFVKEYFHRDPADPLHYDLVLNTSRLPYEDCAEVIVTALGGMQSHIEARQKPQPAQAVQRELARVPR